MLSCVKLLQPMDSSVHGFPRQKYWSGLLLPTPGDFLDPGIEPESPALASGFFTTEPPGKPPDSNIIASKGSTGIFPVPILVSLGELMVLDVHMKK